MNDVLLLIPSNRNAPNATRQAIALAKARGGGLTVVSVLNPEVLDRVSSTLSDVGFMGERVGEQVRETLWREYRTRAEQLAQGIAEQARREGVPAEAHVEEGDPGEICNRLVPQLRIGVAVLVAERRSWLTRLLSRATLRMPALAGCEVRVIEEE